MVDRVGKDMLTSGQLGTITGVSPDTIRHYEKLGLLPKAPRTQGGYRLYQPGSTARVGTIRSALKAGFSLAELSGIFEERDAGGTPCDRVLAMASEKIAGIQNQISELIELRDWLSATVDRWKVRLGRTPPGQPARLLETLAKRGPTG
jgi:DNA-binding transcriptional MerR regulator